MKVMIRKSASGGLTAYVAKKDLEAAEDDAAQAEAEAAFRGLQAKFPSQLGSRQHFIHRVDLGAKGIYFRAMVGPYTNAGEANELCASLKAAGGQCLIQRN
jgi:hypothetical protein